MALTISNTILAYLLALRDFPDVLNDQEKASLEAIAKSLKTQPKAWKDLEPNLIQTIAGNQQLHQSYQAYKEQLDQAEEIPQDLLPNEEEINQIKSNSFLFRVKEIIFRGMIPESPASGYEQQLNNVVIVINSSANPQEAVKQLSSLDKITQFLNQNSP
jgi:hypothetical protein